MSYMFEEITEKKNIKKQYVVTNFVRCIEEWRKNQVVRFWKKIVIDINENNYDNPGH